MGSHTCSNKRNTIVDPTSILTGLRPPPAEFFAVVSEYFFNAPHRLHKHYPKVYEQLALFYLQDPGSRQPRPGKEATP